MTRTELSDRHFDMAIKLIKDHLNSVRAKRGNGATTSRHEVSGVLTEEYDEFLDTVRNNSSDAEYIHELLDVAVSCAWGIASLGAEID